MPRYHYCTNVKIILLIFINLFSGLLYAGEDTLILPINNKKHIIYIQLDTNYYYTNINYTIPYKTEFLSTTNGEFAAFEYIHEEFNLIYAPTPQFKINTFINGFLMTQNKTQNNYNISYTLSTLNKAGFLIRAQQSVFNHFYIIPELSVSVPFSLFASQQTNNTNTVILNDNSVHITPSIWISGSYNTIYPFLYLGFKKKYSDYLSSLLQWKLGVMFKSDITEVGFYAYKNSSVSPKQYTDNQLSTHINLLKKTNVGSLKFSSFNPSVLGFTSWLSFHFLYVSLRFAGEFDINGSQYAKGYNVLASVIIKLNPRDNTTQALFKNKTKYLDFKVKEDETSVKHFLQDINEDEDEYIQHTIEQELNNIEKLEENKTH